MEVDMQAYKHSWNANLPLSRLWNLVNQLKNYWQFCCS